MTQEEKDLLLRDLCARLPYGVIVKDRNGVHKLTTGNTEFADLFTGKVNIFPYLRSMDDMTNEEEFEFDETRCYTQLTLESYDWLNAHHFDYRGLIEKGLALEAPEDMYNLEKK